MAKCKACWNEFKQFKSTQKVCSPKCAIEYAKKQEEKKKLKEIRKWQREQRKKIESKKDVKPRLIRVFHEYIRLRDVNKPCVSCGVTNAEFHAGHYIAAGKCEFLRFNEDNVHKQCEQCNIHFRGNLVPYRIELIKRIGLKKVEWLEAHRNVQSTMTKGDLEELLEEYRQKLKKVKELRGCK